jgi:serine/threonine protein kinase/Tfp pilus assembly protein PilF
MGPILDFARNALCSNPLEPDARKFGLARESPAILRALSRIRAYFTMDPASNSPMGIQPKHRGQSVAKGRSWGGFELIELVGRGSFGEVFRAWDPHLQREIGLKILLPRSKGDEEQFEEMLHEARALASVRHPNIVPIYGVDRHDGLVGFWTDFVHGKTLSQVVREQGPFGYREAALIGLDVAKALSAVHRTGLLHRDIKAENVMREEGGRILLMDFGLTTLAHGKSDLAGTPIYMAPEFFTGGAATVASDIYAVGVLLFYMVAGEFPARNIGVGAQPKPELRGDEVTSEETAVPGMLRGSWGTQRAAGAPASRSVLDFRPDLPEAFARIIDTAINPDPAKRFASAGALSAALSEVLAGPSAGDDAAQKHETRMKARPRWVYGSALVLILIAVAGMLAYFRLGRAPLGGWKSSTASLDASGGLNDKYLKADALLRRSDKRKNVSDAVDLLNDVLKQDPNFALAQAGLGRAYNLQYRVSRTPGLLDQARAACNRAIAIDPSLAPPYITLARIDAMAGNTALATQEVQKALRLDPRSAEAYGAQAEVFDDEGRSADAIASVQKAIDLAPDYGRWPLLLGSYYYTVGKLPQAAEQFRKSTAIAPDNSTAWLDLGLAQIQLERYDDARTSLGKSAQVEPSFAAFSALAELLTTQGKFTESVEMSKKALDLDSTDYLAWGNLASGYLWSPGGHDKAMETYRKAIELAESFRKETPNDPLLLATLGGYYAVTGQTDRSLPLLRQAVALAPDNPDVLFRVGEGYEILHDRRKAILLIAQSLARGYYANQLQRSPELASLRADSKFQETLRLEQAKHSLDKSSKTR